MKTLLVILVLACTGLAQPPDTLWTYTYASPFIDRAYSIAPVAEGGFVVGGETWLTEGSRRALLIRLDAEGHEQWTQIYPFRGTINSIAPFPDGGWALASGEPAFCRMKILRTDDTGDTLWQRCIYHLYMEEAVGIVATADGGIVAVSEGGWGIDPDIFLVRLRANGDSLWARSYGGPAEDHGGAVLQADDGGFFVAGSTNHQAWVFITDSVGVMLWDSTFGDPTLTERLWAACETPSGDYAVSGMWQGSGSEAYHPFAACIRPYGDTLWTRYFPYLGQGSFHSVAALPDGHILLGGGNVEEYDEGYLAVLLTSEGDTVWTARYNTPIDDAGMVLCLASDSGFAIAGYQHTIAENSSNIWVVRSESIYPTNASEHGPLRQFALIASYPNPFNSSTTITFSLPRPADVAFTVFNTLGQAVFSERMGLVPSGEHLYLFDATALPSGLYFARIEAGGIMQARKMVVLK